MGVQRPAVCLESATSVRVRDGRTEITDGPFAVTKEMLGGYYVVECADLDEAVALAARLAARALRDDRGAPGGDARRVAGHRARGRAPTCPDEAVDDLA